MLGTSRINLVGMVCSCAGHLVVGGLLLSSMSTSRPPVSRGGSAPLALELVPMNSTSVAGNRESVTDMKKHAFLLATKSEVAARRQEIAEPTRTGGADMSTSAEAAPAAAGANNTGAASQVDMSDYQRRLYEQIARNSRYPDAAKTQHLAGIVHLAFRLDRAGNVLDSWIQESSGSEMLDTAALEALDRARPLPPIPADLPAQLDFVVEIDSSVIQQRLNMLRG